MDKKQARAYFDALSPEEQVRFRAEIDSAVKSTPKWDPKAGLEAEKRGLLAGRGN